MELTKRKVGGSAAEGSSDDEDVEWGSKRNKQLQAANLAGSLKTDRPNLKLEELDLLFQDPTFDQASGEVLRLLYLLMQRGWPSLHALSNDSRQHSTVCVVLYLESALAASLTLNKHIFWDISGSLHSLAANPFD